MRSLLIISLLLTSFVFAQRSLNSAEVESETKELYLSENWDELIELGEQALQQEIDYFALRYRLGFAYYQQARYAKAIRHFQAAHAFNSQEAYTISYLYGAYQYLEMDGEARMIYRKLPSDWPEKMGLPKFDWLDFAYAEGGAKISNNDSIGTTPYFHVGFGHRLGYRWKLYHGYTLLEQDSYWGAYMQHQYYLSTNVQLRQGLSLQLGGHFLLMNMETELEDLPSSPEYSTDYYEAEGKQTGWVGFGGLSYSFPHISIQGIGAYGQFQDDVSYITGGEITEFGISWEEEGDSLTTISSWQLGVTVSALLPIWKNRIRLTTTVFNQNLSGENHLVWSQTAKLRLTDKFWIQGEYYKGDTRFVVEQQGWVVNNTPDPIQKRISALLTYKINPNNDLFLLYQNEQRIEDYRNFAYQFNTIIAGLKLKL